MCWTGFWIIQIFGINIEKNYEFSLITLKKIEKTYESLEKAIQICKPGTMYRDVGNVIGRYIEDNGYVFFTI